MNTEAWMMWMIGGGVLSLIALGILWWFQRRWLNGMRCSLSQDQSQMQDWMQQRLEYLGQTLQTVMNVTHQLEKERAVKFQDFSALIHHTQEQTKHLLSTTQDLNHILSNSHVRGQWGEKLAEDVLRAAGFVEHIHFVKQQALKDVGGRPDFTFLLPDDRRLHMEVKFPMKHYGLYRQAHSKVEQDAYKKAFLADARACTKSLLERAYMGDGTVGCVLLFIPNDQVLGFMQAEDHEFFTETLAKHVVLCSPTTLLAILSVIRTAVDHFVLEKTTQDILKQLQQFRKQWSMFQKSFDTVAKKLKDTQEEFEKLSTTRARQLEVCLDRLEQRLPREKMESN